MTRRGHATVFEVSHALFYQPFSGAVTMPPMPDRKPPLDYAEPAVKTRRKIPWWLDIPLVILTALGIVLGLIMLAVFFSLG